MNERQIIVFSYQSAHMPASRFHYGHPECVVKFYPVETVAVMQDHTGRLLDISTPEAKETIRAVNILDVRPEATCDYCADLLKEPPAPTMPMTWKEGYSGN